MEETKRCPYCGEEILAVAKKCKYWGEWLNTNLPTKEKKACPICGEEIDADAEICPFCNEPTHFTDGHGDAVEYTNTINITEGEYLYCKNCHEAISANADSCPNCGDNDPFYFKDIKKIRKKNKIGCGGIILLAFLMAVIFQKLGDPNAHNRWKKKLEELCENK